MTEQEKQDILTELMALIRAEGLEYSGNTITFPDAFNVTQTERQKVKIPAIDERSATPVHGNVDLESLLTAYGVTHVEEIASDISSKYMRKTADSNLNMNGNNITNAGNLYTQEQVNSIFMKKVADSDLNMGGHILSNIYKLVPRTDTIGNSSIGNIIPLPYYNSSAVGSSNSITDFLKKIIARICVDYPNVVQGLFLGVGESSGAGAIIINIYSTSDVDSTTGLPRYASCVYITSSTAPSINVASVYNFTFYSREI